MEFERKIIEKSMSQDLAEKHYWLNVVMERYNLSDYSGLVIEHHPHGTFISRNGVKLTENIGKGPEALCISPNKFIDYKNVLMSGLKGSTTECDIKTGNLRVGP